MENAHETVSTIIPTFRRPVELGEAVRSVLAQDVPLEVWIVDDSPERSARGVVDRFSDPRLHYVAMPYHSGGRPGIVRNAALALVRGAYVHFLDDDDIVPDGHYRRSLDRLEARPSLGALFGRVEPFGVASQLQHERNYFAAAASRARFCNRSGRIAFAAMQSFHATMLVCSAGFIRRRCVQEIGGFDPALALNEDADLYARLFQRFEVQFVDEVAVRYRIHASLMHSRRVEDTLEQCYKHMHGRYRRELGPVKFFALKILARTLLNGR